MNENINSKNKIALTPDQQEAVEEIDRNLQIIACAGSGKTEVISRRIANILQKRSDVEPENIVAFTFTEKAADSLKKRIAGALGDADGLLTARTYVGTIHGFCWELLTKRVEKFKDFKILDEVKSHFFVERYARFCGLTDLGLATGLRDVKLFLTCIDKMIDGYGQRERWQPFQREVLEKYRECLYSKKYMDFSLMIFETICQIDESPELQKYLESIKYLVVDEYQDIDDLQEKLISKIVSFGANVCVVGDDDQTIYQFRGSNADNMIEFAERYDNVRQIRLENNFRCAPEIVDVANVLIKNNINRLDKAIFTDKPVGFGEVCATRYYSEEEQYGFIAEKIRALHESGVAYKDIAVLVRKGKRVAPIVSALGRAGIPYAADSSEYFFKGDYFHRFTETVRLLATLDRNGLYNIWGDVLDDRAIVMGFRYLRTAQGNLCDIILEFARVTGFCREDADDLEVRQNALDGMCDILTDYETIYRDYQISAKIKALNYFLNHDAAEEYKYHSFIPQTPDEDTVKVMTVHKAKGLEYHTVFLPDLIAGEFPSNGIGGKRYWHVLGGTFELERAKYQSDTDDERKLFYVAVTRAERNLFLSYDLSHRAVSQFVREAAESPFMTVDRDDLSYIPIGRKKASSGGGTRRGKRTDAASGEKRSVEAPRGGVSAEAVRKPDVYDGGSGVNVAPAVNIPSNGFTVSTVDSGATVRDGNGALRPSPTVTSALEQGYWRMGDLAKNKLIEYYLSGVYSAETFEKVNRIKNASADELIAEAKKLGLM